MIERRKKSGKREIQKFENWKKKSFFIFFKGLSFGEKIEKL